jgi:hypothetical protein
MIYIEITRAVSEHDFRPDLSGVPFDSLDQVKEINGIEPIIRKFQTDRWPNAERSCSSVSHRPPLGHRLILARASCVLTIREKEDVHVAAPGCETGNCPATTERLIVWMRGDH